MSLPNGVIRTANGHYVLESDSHLSRWIEEDGTLAARQGEVFQFLAYIPSGGVVLDAGASLGDHAYTYARRVGPFGTVVAIEPNPLAYECLRRNMEPFDYVRCLHSALSDHGGDMKLNVQLNAGASFLDNEGVTVPCNTVDHLLADLTRLDFVHLDCEGNEPQVLAGAFQTIKKFRPVMVIEVNHEALARQGLEETDIHAQLALHGYRFKELEGTPASIQRDILCLP